MGSETSVKFKQLRWHCRRGMKELDVCLEPFLLQKYNQLSSTQKVAFEALLHMQDDQIWDLLLGVKPVDSTELQTVLHLIRHFQD